MRLIDKKLCNALDLVSRAQADTHISCGGNTQLHTFNSGWSITLHGHTIASKSGPAISLAHCGYVTATTAARLNTITTHLRLGNVGRKQGAMLFTPWINGNCETRGTARAITADGVIL